jgi:sugar phosphate isomerase/epimerase
MTLTLGTTTISTLGWLIDARDPVACRTLRLAAIRELVERHQLSAVELTMDLGIIYPHIFDAGFYAQVADLQQELGFMCTAHLPILWLDPASVNEPVRQASAACWLRTAGLLRPVEVTTYVLHLWGTATGEILALLNSPIQRSAVLQAVLAQAERSLGQLCDVLDPADICVENLESLSFEAWLPLVERCGTSICLDVGHLAWHADSELDFLERHRGRIREVHLHDAARGGGSGNRAIQDHLPLGAGMIDYAAFLHRVQAIDFQGAVILELNSRAALEQSLERLSTLQLG